MGDFIYKRILKIRISLDVTSEKCNSDQLNTCFITKVMKKVFNWSELHLSEVTSYKIHTLGKHYEMHLWLPLWKAVAPKGPYTSVAK